MDPLCHVPRPPHSLAPALIPRPATEEAKELGDVTRDSERCSHWEGITQLSQEVHAEELFQEQALSTGKLGTNGSLGLFLLPIARQGSSTLEGEIWLQVLPG